MKTLSGKTLTEQMAELSSAEDFFLFFLLPYDPAVLAVCRLHILKRMGEYLAKTDFAGLSDDHVFLEARLRLKRAYLDFVSSSPHEQKVFKVLRDAGRPAGFVGLDAIRFAAD